MKRLCIALGALALASCDPVENETSAGLTGDAGSVPRLPVEVGPPTPGYSYAKFPVEVTNPTSDFITSATVRCELRSEAGELIEAPVGAVRNLAPGGTATTTVSAQSRAGTIECYGDPY